MLEPRFAKPKTIDSPNESGRTARTIPPAPAGARARTATIDGAGPRKGRKREPPTRRLRRAPRRDRRRLRRLAERLAERDRERAAEGHGRAGDTARARG